MAVVVSQQAVRCSACKVTVLPNERSSHYQSDWHRYNLKRKSLNMKPMEKSIFEQDYDTLMNNKEWQKSDQLNDCMEQKPSILNYKCTLCSKTFKKQKQCSMHLKSKKHKKEFIKYHEKIPHKQSSVPFMEPMTTIDGNPFITMKQPIIGNKKREFKDMLQSGQEIQLSDITDCMIIGFIKECKSSLPAITYYNIIQPILDLCKVYYVTDDCAECEYLRAQKEILYAAFKYMDVAKNGDINLDEFIIGIKSLDTSLMNHEYQQIFKYIDVENSGYINNQQFVTYFMLRFTSNKLTTLQNAIFSQKHSHIIKDTTFKPVAIKKKKKKKKKKRSNYNNPKPFFSIFNLL